MADRLDDIRKALDAFHRERARELAEAELAENPSAEAYYLASLAARNQGQRVDYLRQALECDPGYGPALAELPDTRLEPEPDITPQAAPTQVVTAAVSLPLASIGRRWLAIAIDGVVVAIPTLMLLGALGIPGDFEAALLGSDQAQAADAFSRFQRDLLLINILVSAVYNVGFMVFFNGQTLGKIVLGMRVVKKNGKRIGWLDAALRNVLGYNLSGLFLLGYLWALFDREKQSWHDKLAGTLVVDERRRNRSNCK